MDRRDTQHNHRKPLDFGAINALVGGIERREETLAVQFCCPESSFEVTAAGRLEDDAPSGIDRDDPAIRRTIVDAFRQVSFHFAWDEVERRYLSVGAFRHMADAFGRMVAAYPIDDEDHEEVLAHILARVACADGGPTTLEREYYEAFASRVETPIETLAEQPMTSEEVEDIDAGTRQTMLMIAWALACAGGSCGVEATRRVERFRDILGIEVERSDVLARFAREYLLDQRLESLYAMGTPSAERRIELNEMGARMGFNEDEVRAIESRFLQRRDQEPPEFYPSEEEAGATASAGTPRARSRTDDTFGARHNPKVREPHTEAPRSPGVFGSGGKSPLER